MPEDNEGTTEAPIELHQCKADSANEPPVPLSRWKASADGRRPLEVDVSLSSQSYFYAGLSDDPSHGLFVATYRPIQTGERVLLRFTVCGEPIETEGEVRWHRPGSEQLWPGVGVALQGLPPSARELIKAFCAERAPLYYEL